MTKFETKPGVKLPKPEDVRPKRFYTDVSVDQNGEGFAVLLDGRSIKTPMKHGLVLPTKVLAQAIADEWAAQGERIDPMTMPLTRLANVVLDQSEAHRDALVYEVIKYAVTDLLRHRADTPDDLVALQARTWNPYLDWADKELGAHLPPVTGILPADAPEASITALRERANGFDVWRLTALVQATSLTGSAVLGFALVEGHADGEAIFDASRVDESFQIAQWGEDAEAAEYAAALKSEILACARLLAAL